MRTLIILLLSCLPLFAATTYPVLTDNANRTFTGGATNMALLSGTNVFTGTNTFSSVSGLYQVLYSNADSNYFSSAAVTATPITNTALFSTGTKILDITVPPARGSNSVLSLTLATFCPVQNSTALQASIFVGANTNFVFYSSNIKSVNAFYQLGFNKTEFVVNHNSRTEQFSLNQTSINFAYPSNFVDTATSWNLKVVAWTTTSHTNFSILKAVVTEIAHP